MTLDTSITHIRPRFEFTVRFTEDNVLIRIKELMEESKHDVTGVIADNHIILDIPLTNRHFWSPQLNFRVEPDSTDTSQSVVKGLIGPRPAVWSMFMFIYFFVGTVGFFIALFGFSKWSLGEYSNLVLALPIAILFMLSAYLTGKYGERLGHDQIETLKQFVRDALNL
jgi:hypothetical protein